MVSQSCFKCGNLGHIAADCTSAKLCYNCKEPGHLSSACPSAPSHDAKQCYGCGQLGHIAADCPQTPDAGTVVRAAVGTRGGGGGRGGASSGGRRGFPRGRGRGGGGGAAGRGRFVGPNATKTCYTCGGQGHIAALCVGLAPGMLPPRKKPQTAADGSPITCRRCGGENHFARDCLAAPSMDDKTCYHCQLKGHIARECPNPAVVAVTQVTTSVE